MNSYSKFLKTICKKVWLKKIPNSIMFIHFETDGVQFIKMPNI